MKWSVLVGYVRSYMMLLSSGEKMETAACSEIL
jgi:hypothetical protein